MVPKRPSFCTTLRGQCCHGCFQKSWIVDVGKRLFVHRTMIREVLASSLARRCFSCVTSVTPSDGACMSGHAGTHVFHVSFLTASQLLPVRRRLKRFRYYECVQRGRYYECVQRVPVTQFQQKCNYIYNVCETHSLRVTVRRPNSTKFVHRT